jgi:hypothetical protein
MMTWTGKKGVPANDEENGTVWGVGDCKMDEGGQNGSIIHLVTVCAEMLPFGGQNLPFRGRYRLWPGLPFVITVWGQKR